LEDNYEGRTGKIRSPSAAILGIGRRRKAMYG
jgi:hypothetical protein